MGKLPQHIELCDARASLVAESPAGMNMFIGFHDIVPHSTGGDELLCLRLPTNAQDMADTADEAEICLWDPAKAEVATVARTRCWNFQQAARQQWIPRTPNRLVYNRLDTDGDLVGAVRDCSSGEERELEGGIYAISPCGRWSIAPDFTRLSRIWPAYGYCALRDREPVNPAATGIWRTDLATGHRSLIVSLCDALTCFPDAVDASTHFLAHPSISPDGKSIVFLHRFFAADGGSYTRLLSCTDRGDSLTVHAEEKVSHFDWLDSDTLLAWARFSGASLAKMRSSGALNFPLLRPAIDVARRFTGRWKKRLLAESYFAMPLHGGPERSRVAWPELDQDGHPMVARRHDWIVTDMYPQRDGTMPLILWNRQTGQRVDVARIVDGVTTGDSDAKCDLHPRWNRDETQIAVDLCVQGLRRIALFDVSRIVKAEQ